MILMSCGHLAKHRELMPTSSRVCRRLSRDGIFGQPRRPVSSCLVFSERHSVVVHSLWQRLKHGTAYRHMSHHHHRWRHSNAISKLIWADMIWYDMIWAVPEIVRSSLISASAPLQLFDFVTCPGVLEVNIDLRHVYHIRYLLLLLLFLLPRYFVPWGYEN